MAPVATPGTAKTFTFTGPKVGATDPATWICAPVVVAPIEPPIVVPGPLVKVRSLRASGVFVLAWYSNPPPVTLTAGTPGSAPLFPTSRVPPFTVTTVLPTLPVISSRPASTIVSPL